MVYPKLPVIERAFRKMDRSGDSTSCWPYLGQLSAQGYGVISLGGDVPARARRLVHVVVYQHLVGPIPCDMELDHICHPIDGSCPGGPSCLHRRCANPTHLVLSTHADNIRRQVGYREDVFRCGHPKGLDNSYPCRGKSGSYLVACLTCQRANWAKQNAKRKARKAWVKETGEVVPGIELVRSESLSIR